MLRIRSLHTRLILFLLLPALVILLADGLFGYFYAHNVLLRQWQEMAILRMEYVAGRIDARLAKPIDLIGLYNRTGLMADSPAARRWILGQLAAIDGVSGIRWVHAGDTGAGGDGSSDTGRGRWMGRGDPPPAEAMIRFRRAAVTRITAPRYDADAQTETVTLVSALLDDHDREVGRLEVAIRFDVLLSDILPLQWWQSLTTGIVDDGGQYLIHSAPAGKTHRRLGETGLAVEDLVKQRLGAPSGTVLGPGRPPGMVAGFHRLKSAPWTVVILASGDSVLAPIIRLRNYFFAEWALFTLLLLVVTRYNVNRIVTPIRELSEAASAVADGRYGAAVTTSSADEIGQLVTSYNRMVEGLKERDLIRNTFGRYMDPGVARTLLGHPEGLRLGGTKRQVAIMMSDIRGFTATAAQLPPDGVIRLLNHYFAHMIEIIGDHRGIIVDFVGDGLLVFFDPVDEALAETACRAVCCANRMIDTLPQLNGRLAADGLPPLTVGIGVNTGEVVVGNIGSEARAKYGIVGAAVNMTQRIQSEAAAGEIVVSAAVYEHAACRLSLDRSFSARPKGLDQDIALFAVNGPDDPASGSTDGAR